MRTRSMILLVCITAVIFAQSAYAAVQTSENLPVYPDGKVAIELNFTNNDFLPAIREFITLWPTFISAALAPGVMKSEDKGVQVIQPFEAIFAELNESFVPELQAAIADLNHVSVVAYTVPEKVKSDQIADYYMQKMGLSKGWTRSITVQDPKGSGSLRVYTKPDLEGIVGIGIQNTRVVVLRTQGKVDLAAITRLSGKMVPVIMSTFASHKEPAIPEPGTETEQPASDPTEDTGN